MKDKLGDGIGLSIHLTDSKEAKKYQLKSATTVLVDDEWVPLDVALSEQRMTVFLKGKLK
jgi:hypothetical protein